VKFPRVVFEICSETRQQPQRQTCKRMQSRNFFSTLSSLACIRRYGRAGNAPGHYHRGERQIATLIRRRRNVIHEMCAVGARVPRVRSFMCRRTDGRTAPAGTRRAAAMPRGPATILAVPPRPVTKDPAGWLAGELTRFWPSLTAEQSCSHSANKRAKRINTSSPCYIFEEKRRRVSAYL